MSAGNYILEADGITVGYHGRTVLRSIYLKIEPGLITGLFGRNGAGKSTLLEIVYGIRQADNSSVRLNGLYKKALYKEKGMVAFLPQKHFLPESIRISKLFKLYDSDFALALEFFPELESYPDRTVKHLSGGDRRLIEVLLILSNTAPFLLLDEPFSNIMPLKRKSLTDLIRNRKTEKGIFLTDHSYHDVLDVCDRSYLLDTNGVLSLLKNPAQDLADRGYLPERHKK